MFYEFSQNNSGGQFVRTRHLDDFVIVEAPTKASAIARAEAVGVYFDGCRAGRDCECCGDRWHEPYEDEGTGHPEIYGTRVTDLSTKREPTKRTIVVHYADGAVKYGRRPGKDAFDLASGDEYRDDGPAKIEVKRQTKAQADARANAYIAGAMKQIASKKKAKRT